MFFEVQYQGLLICTLITMYQGILICTLKYNVSRPIDMYFEEHCIHIDMYFEVQCIKAY